MKCYREQVRQADEIYEKEKARIIKEFDARMQILNDSLTPFNDVPQSDYTVVAKMDVTNDSLGYNEKNRHFYLETTRTMIPTRYTIEMLKMQALIGLVDELRANTTWQRASLSVSLSEQQFSWMVLKMSARPQRNLKPLPFDELLRAHAPSIAVRLRWGGSQKTKQYICEVKCYV